MHFDHKQEITRIVLVGLGGTGSQWGRSIARILFDMRARRLKIPEVTFIDPDIVEMKNVGRQMFAAADVGLNKAQVLARRFNAALGLNIGAVAEPFDCQRHVGLDSWNGTGMLLCGAVDNYEARCELAKHPSCLWIDAGNHFDAGQVVIGNRKHADTILSELKRAKPDGELSYLPNAALLFPQLLEPEPPGAPKVSCADLLQFGEQQLLINDLVANVAAQYVYKVLYRQPIRSFMTYIDADMLNVRSVPITRAELEARLPQKEVA